MFQFPASPALNQVFNPSVGVYYRWNGTGWVPYGVSPSVLPLNSRNVIIGGDFSTNPWQRGTTFAAIGTGVYSADRWQQNNASTGVYTISKSTDVPTPAQCGRFVTHSILLDCTTADAAVGAADQVWLGQFVEGYNFIALAQIPMVLSFWHKHTKTGTHSVGFGNTAGGAGAQRFIGTYTQLVSDTWEYAEIPIPASPSAGTWDYINGIGLAVKFVVMAGTNVHGTAGTWQAAVDILATSAQPNNLDNVANNFRLALVQLEAGSVASSFENRSLQDELLLCKRYYEKTFAQGTAPAQNVGSLSDSVLLTCPASAGGVASVQWQFEVEKRAAPGITTYNPAAANANFRDFGNAADVAVTVNPLHSKRTFIFTNAGVAGTTYQIHAAASAEL